MDAILTHLSTVLSVGIPFVAIAVWFTKLHYSLVERLEKIVEAGARTHEVLLESASRFQSIHEVQAAKSDKLLEETRHYREELHRAFDMLDSNEKVHHDIINKLSLTGQREELENERISERLQSLEGSIGQLREKMAQLSR